MRLGGQTYDIYKGLPRNRSERAHGARKAVFALDGEVVRESQVGVFGLVRNQLFLLTAMIEVSFLMVTKIRSA